MSHAYVNHGRWVAECDTPHCTEALEVEPDQEYRCAGCGRKLRVVWPTDKGLIDQALRGRLVKTTRNWYPNETVLDLLAENREHATEVNA